MSKWKSRLLPTFRDYYEEHGRIPGAITFSFAALMEFYTADKMENGALAAIRTDGTAYFVRDDAQVLEFMMEHSQKSIVDYTHAMVTNEGFWGEDLSKYAGFEQSVSEALTSIRTLGAREAAAKWLEEKC